MVYSIPAGPTTASAYPGVQNNRIHPQAAVVMVAPTVSSSHTEHSYLYHQQVMHSIGSRLLVLRVDTPVEVSHVRCRRKHSRI